MYGYDPPQFSFELVAQSKVAEVDQWLQERQIMAKALKVSLAQMKFFAEKNRTEREFEAGDGVYLKLQADYCCIEEQPETDF